MPATQTAEDAFLPDPHDRPMVGLALACKAIDIGVTKGYELVAAGQFPVTVRRVGGVWKVSTAELHRFIGSEPGDIAESPPVLTGHERSALRRTLGFDADAPKRRRSTPTKRSARRITD